MKSNTSLKEKLEEVFDDKYKSLNKEQKEAVDTIEGPVLVVAGPGTGKTTLLTLRIANILRKTDTPPSGILALTFTDVGVKVMRSKLREIIGSRADEVRIHTFHSFASSVISEFNDHFPHLSRTSQITEVEQVSIIRELLKQKKFTKLRPLGDPDYYVGKIISGIGNCKKEAWTSEILKKFLSSSIKKIKDDPESISTRGVTKGLIKAEYLKKIDKCERTAIFAELFDEYENRKKKEKKMDFDDLLSELLIALEKDELLLRLIQETYLYMLVDEHQDTNDSQNKIIYLLANFFDTPNLFVVGDEKQAIYRFQGASVENFLKFQNIWKNMKVIPLVNNYRSHQSILDASFAMIENNYNEGQYPDLRIQLTSKSSEKNKPIDLIVAENTDAMDEYLMDGLDEFLKENKDNGKTAAVIVRENRDVLNILSLAQNRGLEVSAERGIDIFSHPIGSLYFTLLEYLIDPTKVENLAETFAAGLWNIDFAKSAELIKKLRAGFLSEVFKEVPALKQLQDISFKSGVIDYLILMSESSGLSKMIVANPVSVEVWRGIVSLAQDIASTKEITDPRELIKELVAYKISAEKKKIKVSSGTSTAQIRVTTAHGSKGLEYDYVFLPYAMKEFWMRKHKSSSFVFPLDKDDKDEERDARRLFYVALTRARSHATILVGQKNSLGKEFTPLQFIDELHKDHVLSKHIPAKKDVRTVLSFEKSEAREKKEIIDYAKNIILEKGLSVTALNHYCSCPSEFYYKSILKVPEAPSPSSEKGIAMHKALSYCWELKIKKVTNIEETIISTVKSYFKTSLLPSFEKEEIIEELVHQAPMVASALENYFSNPGKVMPEKWVETIYSGNFQKEVVKFELHGQLDALIEGENKVEVYDYKTREGMSVNAIKGETKDSDGNYFRQLIFYRMLLENKYKDKEIEPWLIFIKPDSKGRCPLVSLPISKDDILRVRTEIDSLIESVWSGSFLTSFCSEAGCKWCEMKKQFLV
ncbi:ATP-dependent helicase [Patescibacteria group bacterium]|nr:ATP-dependent helicase [Patescibacteria group bacterium]